MDRSARLPRLAAVAVALVAVALLSRAQDVTGSPSGATRPDASAARSARTAAQTHLGLLSGGDWPGAWADWSHGARQRVPRATYVRVHRTCHPLLAVPLHAVRTVAVDSRTVDVHWRGGGTSGTLRMVHEGERWRVAMTGDQLAPYTRGPDSAIAVLRRRGACGSVTSTPASPVPSAG
ncbi:hypothetical protein [Streptomyces sp. NPDC006368]|uniref:hypothetical protein n=1 Tax=Streptomyces sp. NPDC006368 TaxID=3156760 RepID=UPI00339DE08E